MENEEKLVTRISRLIFHIMEVFRLMCFVFQAR